MIIKNALGHWACIGQREGIESTYLVMQLGKIMLPSPELAQF